MFVSQIYDEVSEILGTTDQTKIFRKLTQAVQILMESGHWFHTNAEVDVCTGWDNVTITLPRDVEIPLAINVDGSPLYFRDRMFQYHVNKGGVYNTVEWAWDDRGYHAIMMDITRPSQIVAVAESSNDAGKYLRVLGQDKWGRPLRSQLPDGTGVDGLRIPIHSQQDFQYGTIAPDGNTVNTRQVTVTPMTKFTTATPHFLTSGEGMVLTAPTGTVPIPLSKGVTYYVGVLDALTIQLYSNSLNAANAQYPLALEDITGYQSLQLLDSRTSQVLTALKVFWTQNSSSSPYTQVSIPASPVALSVGNEIVFPAGNLPSPLQNGVTYFANQLDSTHLQIFSNLSDAQNNVNPISTTGSTAAIAVDVRKAISPNTKLTFTSPHYFQPGDLVQASNAGGALPQPLLSNQNYYVGVLDSTTATLHLSASDAGIGANPINLVTSGSGANSLVKLNAATPQFGASNNMTATGTNFVAASGTGATAIACVSGPMVNPPVLNNAGNGYAAVPTITLSDVGGAGYDSSTTVSFVGNCTTSAVAHANITGGRIISITVDSTGSGYVTPPTVFISNANGVGKGAFALAVLTSGAVTSVNLQPIGNGASITVQTGIGVTNAPLIITSYTAGSGYEIPPYVTITDASGGSGASASCQVSYSIATPTIGTGGTYSTAPTVQFSAPQISGGVTAIGTVQTSGTSPNIVVTGITVTNAGTGYTTAPSITFSSGAATASVALNTATSGAILQGSISGIVAGSGFSSAPKVTFSGGGTPSTMATATAVMAGTGSNQTVSSITITNTGAGYTSTPTVYVGGNGASITTSITTNFVSRYILTNITPGGGTGSTSGGTGSGYTYAPYVQFSGSLGSGATAQAQINNATGQIVSILPVTQGSGYTATPGISLVPLTGNFVQFTSTGTLPSPLVQGTPYMVGTPSQTISGAQSFTVLNADGSPITITGLGNGTLYVAVSRTFGVGWTSYWTGDFSGLFTGQQIYFGSDYLLPAGVLGQSGGGTSGAASATVNASGQISLISVSNQGTGYTYPPVVSFTGGGGGTGAAAVATVNTNGNITGITITNAGKNYLTTPTIVLTSIGQSVNASIDNDSTPFYLRIQSNASGQLTQVQIYSTQSYALAGGPIGLVTVSTFGTGQTYYALRQTCQSLPYNNSIIPSSVQYLQNGETVQFSTTPTGTLPSPLLANIDYTILTNGNSFTVYGSNNLLITLENSGTGQLFTNIKRAITPMTATTLTASESLYETGVEVFPRANIGDVLPSGLTPATPYFIRRVDNSTFELYDTYAHALNTLATTGRVSYLTTGNSLTSYFFVDSLENITFVKSVSQVDKPITDGYVSLYAYDYGRTNDMTLIGQYHPTETNPQYRRVRIGKPCAWARIMYRVHAPTITSIYDFIPLEQTRAIINAVHAVDLEDKDFAEQSARYLSMAYKYLSNQQEAVTGHAMQAPQINNLTYGDGSDYVMF
jgi:hypothetical protein